MSPLQNKRRTQRKIINSIDASISKRYHYKNYFGLDFSLMNNPLYNPFPLKHNNLKSSTIPINESVIVQNSRKSENNSFEKHKSFEKLTNNSNISNSQSLLPNKKSNLKIKKSSQVFSLRIKPIVIKKNV